ncbi:MAG: DegT/DnrJ/EryC1/StrS family aminotransferase [Planctomycetota bacterium]|jgi:perosamine synthetase
MRKIHYSKPSITELEVEYVTDAIKHGWGEHCFDYIERLQTSFKNYLRVKYALATSSCTGALHLILAALGIKEKDEVIVPDITWAASAVPIVYLKAKPVFVDILPDSWCIDPVKIESAISTKTKAIVVVHLYGNCVEMDTVLEIGRKYNLPVIEDVAEALGSEYKGRKAGTMGDFGVFSFHGTKTMSTGEGGMLVSNRQSLFEEVNILADHGRNPKSNKMFWMERIGYKYKMSNLQAALGCGQVERLDELVDKRREVFRWYQEYFKNTPGIRWNPEPEYTKNSFWMPTIIFDEPAQVDRDSLIQKMVARDIHIRPFFYPLSSMPMFEEKRENKISYGIYSRGINLPSYFDLTHEDVNYVCENLEQLVNCKQTAGAY